MLSSAIINSVTNSLEHQITLFKVGKIHSLLGDVMRIEATWAESCSSNFCFHFVRDSRYFRVTVDADGNQKDKIHNFGFFHNKMFDCPLIQVLWLRYKGNMFYYNNFISNHFFSRELHCFKHLFVDSIASRAGVSIITYTEQVML